MSADDIEWLMTAKNVPRADREAGVCGRRDGVEVTNDRIWPCGWGQTVASYDGERWKEASIDHGATEPASGISPVSP